MILSENRGICGVRENQNGKLVSLVYGKAIAVHVDPIEKKPLFHFLPGSFSYSIATVGCNLRCSFCQNWEISQLPKEHPDKITGEDFPPERVIYEAIATHCESIAYTYTEPTIFTEYALDTMKLAKKKGLKNIWVTNGYMSKKCLKLIAPYLDAANVDLKTFNPGYYQKICGIKMQPVLDNLAEIKKLGIFLEVTTLIIPTLNDSPDELKATAEFIAQKLGKETPWHISRFFPAYKIRDIIPTPIETLKKAYDIGKEAGINFVYVGNVPGTDLENTHCPKCGKVAIERRGYSTKLGEVSPKGRCKKCGQDLNLILKP